MTAIRLSTSDELDPFLASIPMPAMVMRASFIIAANDRFCELLGRTRAEVLGSPDPFHDFIAPEYADRVLARHQARAAGQSEPDEYDFAMRARDGSAIPARVRVARYPPADPAGFLLLFSDERSRSRNAELIRVFVDVAVSAQRERTQEAIFRLVQERLQAIGLSVHFSVLSGSTFELLDLGGADHAGSAALRARWPRELPIEVFQELRPPPGSAQGTLIDDLPGVIARALGKKRDELGPGIPASAVFCLVPVEGVSRFALSATGPGLDATVASAFGLFGQQLGTSLETLRRMDELARSNRDLSSAATENARLYAEQRARAEEMTLLNEVSRSFAGALEIKPLLAAAGQALLKLANATNWFVMLRERRETSQGEVEVLRAAACSPEHEEFMRRIELRLDQRSLSAEAVRQRRALQAQEPNLSLVGSRQLVKQFGERSLLVVPLIARDEVLGVVALDDIHRARVFSEAEIGRITAVCQQIALALLSARLYQDLRESYAELARTQAELIQRERLAALGEMAATLAHEVRNPLGVIFNSIGSLRRLLQPSGDVRLLIDIVGEEADRLNRMVGDLLDYSRPLKPALQPVALRAILEEAITSARQPGEDSTVEVRLHLEPGLPPVSADGRLLRQALVNVFTNSFHAMPHGGTLTVGVVRVLSGAGAQVRISIHDTGFGIPPNARTKIFEPFFTTKPTGTGLGLAVVKRIVEGHGGRIRLADCERGTEFHLFLPLSEVHSASG